MMDKMKPERLIELAEAAGEISPTAEEQNLLKSDPALRKELEDLTRLLADLRNMPEERVDPASQASILHAVREAIAASRRRSPLAWIGSRPAFAHFVAVAASLLLVAGIFFLTAPYGSREGFPPNPENPDNLALAIDISGSNLLDEAATWEDVDLLPELEELNDAELAAEYLARNTHELMETAANLDEEYFVQLNEMLGQDGLW